MAGLSFADEFDGPAGTPPAAASWTAEHGPGGNGERQVYTAANAALDGRGNLAITARREYSGRITSARLITRGRVSARYGRVEARIRVPAGRGVWPAARST